MRTYAAALTPLTHVYAMRTHRPRPPPPSVRTYIMDVPLMVIAEVVIQGWVELTHSILVIR